MEGQNKANKESKSFYVTSKVISGLLGSVFFFFGQTLFCFRMTYLAHNKSFIATCHANTTLAVKTSACNFRLSLCGYHLFYLAKRLALNIKNGLLACFICSPKLQGQPKILFLVVILITLHSFLGRFGDRTSPPTKAMELNPTCGLAILI